MNNAQDFNSQNYQQNMYNQGNQIYNQQDNKKGNPLKKILIIFGIIMAIIIVIGLLFTLVLIPSMKANNNQLICKSNQGNLTIFYNDERLVGYTASGISYDLDDQSEYADQVGVESYINEFKTYFEDKFNGSCEIELKEDSNN